MEHFTKAFAKEIGGRGITVNCIAPGPQRTSFLYGAENQTLAWLASMTISGALGDPVERGAGDAVPGRSRDPVGLPPRPFMSTGA